MQHDDVFKKGIRRTSDDGKRQGTSDENMTVLVASLCCFYADETIRLRDYVISSNNCDQEIM